MPVAFRTRQRTDANQRLVETNQGFQEYLHLPQELRTMVINRMTPKTRLQFADCSSLCREDVMKSKNIVEKISLYMYDETDIECDVNYALEDGVEENQFYGFMLQFRKQGNTQTMTYVRKNRNPALFRTLWTTQIENTTDIPAGIIRFKTLFLKLRHKVGGVCLNDIAVENFGGYLNCDIVPMKNLYFIAILGNMDIFRFLSKTHQPLEAMVYRGEKYVESIPNWKQVYSATRIIEFPNVSFTNEQFLKISAVDIYIHIGQLSVKNIIDYINEWIDGKRDHLKYCRWNLKNSNIEIGEIFDAFRATRIRFLRDVPFSVPIRFVVLQTNTWKRATVRYSGDEEDLLMSVEDW